ncbi:MAG: YfhO family protein [Candidatus Andersenbacteria bacterium]
MLALAFYPLWLGRFYAIGDMRDVFIPLELFFQQQLRIGNLPAWHPDVAWGFPAIAAAQIGFFYPPLLLGRLLPLWFYLPLILVLHFFALAWGTFLFLKKLSCTSQAAVLGSISLSLSAFLWQHLTHLNITLILAWLPWQLLVAHRLAEKPTRWQYLLGAVVTIALPFLAGQLQLPLIMAAFTTIYFFRQSRAHSHFFRNTACIWIIITLAVIAVSAVQLLPTLELLLHSSRGSGGAWDSGRANQHSFPLYHLPTLLFPRFFGTDSTYWGKRLEIEYGIFIGTIPLLLSLWAIWRFRPSHRFWVATATISFLLALGSASPFRLVGLEPSLWYFSAPARWLVLTTLSLSILAAFGYDYLRQHAASFRKFSARASWLLATVVAVANIAIYIAPHFLERLLNYVQSNIPSLLTGRPVNYYEEKVRQLLTSIQDTSVSLASPFTWLTLMMLLLTPWLVSSKRWYKLLIAAAALELILIAATSTPTISWRNILTPPQSLSVLPAAVQEKQARLLSRREGGDTGAYFTNPASRADTALRAQQRQLLLPLMHAQYQIAGIEWPASLDLQSHAHYRERLQDESGNINTPLAEYLNIGAVLVPPDLSQPESLSLYRETDAVKVYQIAARPRAEVVTVTGEPIADTQASYRETSASTAEIQIDTSQPSLLLIRNTWYPGWRATIDDKPEAVKPVSEIFQGVTIPSGRYVVKLNYQPTWLYVGLSVSLVASLLLGLGVVYARLFKPVSRA